MHELIDVLVAKFKVALTGMGLDDCYSLSLKGRKEISNPILGEIWNQIWKKFNIYIFCNNQIFTF